MTDTLAGRLRESLRSGLLFGEHNEPLDDYGKRIVRVILSQLEALDAAPAVIGVDLASGPDRTAYFTPAPAAPLSAEPVVWMVESTHSGDVHVRETFDDEGVAKFHAETNGGVVFPSTPAAQSA